MTKLSRRTIVIHGEAMGEGPPELGATLMGSFLRNLATSGRHPDTIVFYNSGVKLLLSPSATAEPLRRLAALGVDLVACGTCVAWFSLPPDELVGRVGNMQEIAAVLGESDVVVTL